MRANQHARPAGVPARAQCHDIRVRASLEFEWLLPGGKAELLESGGSVAGGVGQRVG
jgi:hypothetical protein